MVLRLVRIPSLISPHRRLADASIVDEYIDAAKPLLRGCRSPLERVRMGEISRMGQDRSAPAGHRGGQRPEGRCVLVDGHDVDTAVGKAERHRPTESARRARHDRGLRPGRHVSPPRLMQSLISRSPQALLSSRRAGSA
jgi:hypothetical protein